MDMCKDYEGMVILNFSTNLLLWVIQERPFAQVSPHYIPTGTEYYEKKKKKYPIGFGLSGLEFHKSWLPLYSDLTTVRQKCTPSEIPIVPRDSYMR